MVKIPDNVEHMDKDMFTTALKIAFLYFMNKEGMKELILTKEMYDTLPQYGFSCEFNSEDNIVKFKILDNPDSVQN